MSGHDSCISSVVGFQPDPVLLVAAARLDPVLLQFCTPPAKNAPVDLDGSTRAGLGVCAHNSREWASVIAHAGSVRYHRARFDDFCESGLKASAARHKKAAEHHERYLRAYADGLLSGLHLF